MYDITVPVPPSHPLPTHMKIVITMFLVAYPLRMSKKHDVDVMTHSDDHDISDISTRNTATLATDIHIKTSSLTIDLQ